MQHEFNFSKTDIQVLTLVQISGPASYINSHASDGTDRCIPETIKEKYTEL